MSQTKPKLIEVGGVEFKILWDTLVPDDPEAWGETDWDERNVRIAPKAKKKKERGSTLFHECIHVALMATGHSEWLGEKEESIVVALEQMLAPHLGLFAVVSGQALPLPEKKAKPRKPKKGTAI